MKANAIVPALAGACLAACLQVEPPPPAGSLVTELMSTGLDDASAFVTDDGWRVVIETAALSLGEVRLLGERCDPYSESNYLRVFDLRRPGVQRVNVGFALGECDVAVSLFTPANDAVIGAGIDDATVSFMRVVASDPFVTERGVAFLVSGRAEREGAVVQFTWPFRQAFGFQCSRVTFEANVARTVRLDARAPALFHLDGEGGPARFEPIAAADTDASRDITLEELAEAPPTNDSAPNLGDQLYFTAMPGILALADGGRCRIERIEIHRRPDRAD